MKKFIVNLFSNRFGIVLAALNACYFVYKIPGLFDFPRSFFARLFVSLNAPALIATGISHEILSELLPKLTHETQYKVSLTLIGIFIVLQWLFIAWIAKTLAQKFRPAEL